MPDTKPPYNPNNIVKSGVEEIGKSSKPAYDPNNIVKSGVEKSAIPVSKDFASIPTEADKSNQLENTLNDIVTTSSRSISDGEKDMLRDILSNPRTTPDQAKESIKTMQGYHDKQKDASFESPLYYVKKDDNGVIRPVPLSKGERPPHGFDVANVWGQTKKQSQDDSWYTDLAKSLFNAVPATAQSAAEIGNWASQLVTGEESNFFTRGENYAKSIKLNKDDNGGKALYNPEGIKSVEDLVSKDRFDLSPEALWNTVNWAAETLPQFLLGAGEAGLAIKGGKALLGLKGAGELGVVGQKAAIYASSYAMQIGENMADGRAAGLKGRDVSQYAGMVTNLQASIDAFTGLDIGAKIFNQSIKKSASALVKNFAKGAEKDAATGLITEQGFKKIAKDFAIDYGKVATSFVKEAGKDVAGEMTQEVLQEVSVKAGQQMWDNMSSDDKAKFGTNALSAKSFGDYISAGINSLGVAPISIATAKSKYNEQSIDALKIVEGGKDKMDEFKANVYHAVRTGQITEQERDQAVFKVDAYKKYSDQISDIPNLSKEDKKNVFELSFNLEALKSETNFTEDELKNLDPIARAKVDNKKEIIKGLQKDLNGVLLRQDFQQETRVGQSTVDKIAKETEPLKEGEEEKPDIKEILKRFPTTVPETAPDELNFDEQGNSVDETPISQEEDSIDFEIGNNRSMARTPINKFTTLGFNTMAYNNPLRAKAIMQDHLKYEPNNEMDVIIRTGKNGVYTADIGENKQIRFAQSAKSNDPNAPSFIKRENLPATKENYIQNVEDKGGDTSSAEGEHEYFYKEPAAMKRVEIDSYDTDGEKVIKDGKPVRKAAIVIYNKQSGGFIGFAREHRTGRSNYSPREEAQFAKIANANFLSDEINPYKAEVKKKSVKSELKPASKPKVEPKPKAEPKPKVEPKPIVVEKKEVPSSNIDMSEKISVTDEVYEEWSKLDNQEKEDITTVKGMSNLKDDDRSKRIKAIVMISAAKKRKILGTETAIEKNTESKYNSKIHIGDSVTINGSKFKVTGFSFGRVKVSNGKTYLIDSPEIKQAIKDKNTPKPVVKPATKPVIKAEPKPKVEAKPKAEPKPKSESKPESKPYINKLGGDKSAFGYVFHGGDVKGISVATLDNPLYLSETESQAAEYAKGNNGKVRKFQIDKSKLANEDEVRKIINDLGLKSSEANGGRTDDLNIYELIDPNFETSMNESDRLKLYSELEKMGYGGIEFLGMNIKSLKNDINDIVVFNPKLVSKSESLLKEQPIQPSNESKPTAKPIVKAEAKKIEPKVEAKKEEAVPKKPFEETVITDSQRQDALDKGNDNVAINRAEKEVNRLRKLPVKELFKELVIYGIFNLGTQRNMEMRPDVGFADANEYTTTLRQVEQGKDTKTVQKLYDFIDKIKDTGKVNYIQGLGSQTERYSIPLHESILEETNKERGLTAIEEQENLDKVDARNDAENAGYYQRTSDIKGDVQKVLDRIKKSFPKVKVVLDENLDAAGRLKGNVLTINPYFAGKDTPIHEAGHVLIDAIGYNNKVIQAAIKQLKGTSLWTETKERYKELNKEGLGKEVLAEAIGREGADIFDKAADRTKFKVLLDYIFDWVKTKLGVNKNIAKSLAKQIIGGYKTKSLTGENEDIQFAKKKAAQELNDTQKLIDKVKSTEDLSTLSAEYLSQVLLAINQSEEITNKERTAAVNDVRIRIAMNIDQRQRNQIKADPKLAKLFDEGNAATQDINPHLDVKYKVLSHFTSAFPAMQYLSKLWDNAWFSKMEESIREKTTHKRLANAVIDEKNKQIGRIKAFVGNLIMADNAKYFEYIDNNGKLLTMQEANAKGLSKAQKDYLSFVRETMAERKRLIGNEDIYNMDMEVLKLDKGFYEAFKSDGITQAFGNWLGNTHNISNVRISFVNPNTGKTEITEYKNIEKALVAYGSTGDIKTKAESLKLLAKYNKKARKQSKLNRNEDQNDALGKNILKVSRGGDYTLDENMQLKSKFNRNRDAERGYSKDFYKAMTEFIDDSMHIKHVSPLMPIINAIEHLNTTGVTKEVTDENGDVIKVKIMSEKPNLVKWLQEWQDLHILKKPQELGQEIDFALRTLRFMTSLKTMLFNVPANIMNLGIGLYNNWVDQDFNNYALGLKRLFVGNREFSKEGGFGLVNKYSADLVRKYATVSTDRDSNPTVNAKNFIIQIGFALQNLGEFIIQGSGMLGQLSETEYNGYEYKENKYKHLELVAKDPSKAAELRQKILDSVNNVSDVQGKYSDKDQRNIVNNELGKAVMLYKTWIPDWLRTRFGDEGTYRTLFRGAFAELRADINAKGAGKAIWENKAAMKSIKELMTIVFLMSLLYDDDDDKEKSDASKLAQRALGDILFIFDTDNVRFISTKPIAIMSAASGLVDVADHLFALEADDYYKNGDPKLKNDLLKLTPKKNIDNIIDFVDGEEQ